ncbi:MAG: NAD(P)H-hydrate dehydratase [Nitrospiraceae bacterium]|nr:MAG: NAD(P)H-hydrate dehydratase [Nitrospiraceae bacterium]
MIKVATAKEMQDIDRLTIDRFGIPGTVLMERAGLSAVEKINEFYPNKKIAVLCGGGNNGGDGFVIARELHNQGRKVDVFITTHPAKLKGDAKTNYEIAKKFKVPVFPARKFVRTRFSAHHLIVDALLGTGLSKSVKAPLSDVIKKVNRLSCPVVAVDIPSGISSDTGQVMGTAVKADVTVTFGLPKRGHLIYPGAEYTGRLCIEDIGFPAILLASEKIRINLFRSDDAHALLPVRPKSSHKGTYGHALVVAGSRGKTGAALMTARACLKAGAGLVTIGTAETVVNSLQSRVTEEMILPLEDNGNGTVSYRAASSVLNFLDSKGNVLVIGPGLSAGDEIPNFVAELITRSRVPVVIDADGLNAIANKIGVLKKSKAPVILTPHPGEMVRLEGPRTGDIQDRISRALMFASKYKVFMVLKGVPTVTATPDGMAYINSSGNPGMATAGAGDVLTGMIASFLAQGLTPQNASALGVYMHGYAGDIAADKKGQESLVASDIIKEIPGVFRSVKSC